MSAPWTLRRARGELSPECHILFSALRCQNRVMRVEDLEKFTYRKFTVCRDLGSELRGSRAWTTTWAPSPTDDRHPRAGPARLRPGTPLARSPPWREPRERTRSSRILPSPRMSAAAAVRAVATLPSGNRAEAPRPPPATARSRAEARDGDPMGIGVPSPAPAAGSLSPLRGTSGRLPAHRVSSGSSRKAQDKRTRNPSLRLARRRMAPHGRLLCVASWWLRP